MPIVFDEIEATVLPEAPPRPAGIDAGAQAAQGAVDANTLQSELARMLGRAERLRAD